MNARPAVIDALMLSEIPAASRVEWLSPIEFDAFAEYRDRSFLERIGRPELTDALSHSLARTRASMGCARRTDTGEIILVEAEAHIDEMLSAGTRASEPSLQRIRSALDQTIKAFGATPAIDWTGPLYQTANRLAHLHFFTEHDVPARLVFVCFVGDGDVSGPSSADEWRGALRIVRRMLGLSKSKKPHHRYFSTYKPTRNIDPALASARLRLQSELDPDRAFDRRHLSGDNDAHPLAQALLVDRPDLVGKRFVLSSERSDTRLPGADRRIARRQRYDLDAVLMLVSIIVRDNDGRARLANFPAQCRARTRPTKPHRGGRPDGSTKSSSSNVSPTPASIHSSASRSAASSRAACAYSSASARGANFHARVRR